MKERNRYIRLGYGIFLGVFTAVIGILLIVGAAQIYYADPAGEPYSREIVGKKLMQLLAPLILWIVAIIAGYVLSVLFPYAGKRGKQSPRDTLRKIRQRVPQGDGEEFLFERKRLEKFELARFILRSVCAAFALLAAVMSIVYLAKTAHFPADDITAEILNMLRHILPWVGATFALYLLLALYEGISAKYELASVKKLLVLGKGMPLEEPSALNKKAESAERVASSRVTILSVRIAVLALAVLLIVLGIVNGGMSDVLTKAINICTECIGLG